MFPSVDRVGRYFPLTVFATLPREAVGLVVADRCAQWFERVEDLVLAQLEDDSRDADQFEAALAETALLLSAAFDADASVPPGVVYPDVGTISTDCLHFALGDRVDPAPVALAWLDQLIARSVHAPVYWWTSGSEVIRPSWLVSRGLPEPAAFAAMLSGDWFDWPWQSQDNALPLLASGPAALHFESAGKTHPGKVRKENQDAFAARPECGLWAVADGMGGHAEGHIASQMVRDALAALEPQASLARSVEAVGAALSEVNGYLYSLSLRPVNPVVSGTTVVVLLLGGAKGVCLWAGDSRLYRLRNGSLEQLTDDHSETGEDESDATAGSNVITRAVGGHARLELDHAGFDVQLGDRFLLCSDGLYREISAEGLRQILETGDAISTVGELINQTLLGEAADNVTAVIVDVQPEVA